MSRSNQFPERSSRHRRGFTLMEILIVLAILVMVTAIAMPSLSALLRAQKLQSAADTVRIEWTRTHVLAMKSGRIQVFRYEIGGRKYKIEPWIAGDDELEASAQASAQVQSMQFGTPAPSQGQDSEGSADGSNQLPEGILFLAGEAQGDARDLNVEEQIQQSGSGGSGSQWSRPILFYPDGVTSDAWLIVANEEQSGIRVALRGMTGIAAIGEAMSTEELEK